jgi:hypothetical protein
VHCVAAHFTPGVGAWPSAVLPHRQTERDVGTGLWALLRVVHPAMHSHRVDLPLSGTTSLSLAIVLVHRVFLSLRNLRVTLFSPYKPLWPFRQGAALGKKRRTHGGVADVVADATAAIVDMDLGAAAAEAGAARVYDAPETTVGLSHSCALNPVNHTRSGLPPINHTTTATTTNTTTTTTTFDSRYKLLTRAATGTTTCHFAGARGCGAGRLPECSKSAQTASWRRRATSTAVIRTSSLPVAPRTKFDGP